MENNQFKKSMDMVLYQTDGGDVSVEAYIKDETLWISQKSMAELFGVDAAAVNKHLTNIFADGELMEAATVSKMEIVQKEGSRSVKREMKFYNLDAIISVGYRVNSHKGRYKQVQGETKKTVPVFQGETKKTVPVFHRPCVSEK